MLDSLPEELLETIVSILDVKSLVALSGTSRLLRAITQAPRVWYERLETSAPFNAKRNYAEDYAWRHGQLAVNIRSDLAPRDDELFRILTFFPLHRAYSGLELSSACSEHYLPWAKETLASYKRELLLLAVRCDSIIAHSYHADRNESRHTLEIIRKNEQTLTILDLPDWPLCASFLGHSFIVVCGRFPAMLVYSIGNADITLFKTVSLSSHAINCLALDDPDISKRIVLGGHYKGRGSLEMITYDFDEDEELTIDVVERNRFGGITAISSCILLPGGYIVTYDNFCHIYLWSNIHSTLRKIDHDGIGRHAIPSDLVYKMFYNDCCLVFIDQYKRQTGFVVSLGKMHATMVDCDNEQSEHEKEVEEMLGKQNASMGALARKILGMS